MFCPLLNFVVEEIFRIFPLFPDLFFKKWEIWKTVQFFDNNGLYQYLTNKKRYTYIALYGIHFLIHNG